MQGEWCLLRQMKNAVYGEAPLFQVRFQKAFWGVVDKSKVAERNSEYNIQMDLPQIGVRLKIYDSMIS